MTIGNQLESFLDNCCRSVSNEFGTPFRTSSSLFKTFFHQTLDMYSLSIRQMYSYPYKHLTIWNTSSPHYILQKPLSNRIASKTGNLCRSAVIGSSIWRTEELLYPNCFTSDRHKNPLTTIKHNCFCLPWPQNIIVKWALWRGEDRLKSSSLKQNEFERSHWISPV